MSAVRGSVAVVTGAGNGLGRAISLALASSGYTVALLGRAEAKLTTVANEIRALGAEAQFMNWFLDQQNALIGTRIAIDQLSNTEIKDAYTRIVYDSRVAGARQIGHRAVERGEIESSRDSVLAMELIIGAVHTHWQFTPDGSLPRFHATLPDYTRRVLEVVIRGLGLQPEAAQKG